MCEALLLPMAVDLLFGYDLSLPEPPAIVEQNIFKKYTLCK